MKMKYALAIILALAMTLSLLAGCADTEEEVVDEEPDEDVEEEVDEEPEEEEVDIDIVVGFGAGGSNDVAARYMAEALRDHGINADIVNMPGGMGTEAAYHVSQQSPDSNMFMWGQSMTMAFEPSIDDRGFTIDDFEMVGMLASPTFCLGSRTGAPWEDFDDLKDYIRDNPGELTLGGQGEGSMMHFYAELMLPPDELDYAYVGFEGGADVAINLTGGHVDLGHLSLAAARPLHDDEDLTVLVNTQIMEERDPMMPDIPNISEYGLEDAREPHALGLFAPQGTDPDLIERISTAMEAVSEDPDLQQNYEETGLITAYMNADEMAEYYDNIMENFVPQYQEWYEDID